MTHVNGDDATAVLLAEYAAGTRDFIGRKWRDLRLGQCDLSGARFTDCEFLNCIFALAQFKECVFQTCRLQQLNAIGASFEGTVFRDCEIREAAFGEADFFRASFMDCTSAGNYREAFFVQATFKQTVFEGSVFQGTIFGLNTFEEVSFVVPTLNDIKMAGPSSIDLKTVSDSLLLNNLALGQSVNSPGNEEVVLDLRRALRGLERFFLAAGVEPETVRAHAKGSSFQQSVTHPTAFLSYSTHDEEFVARLHRYLESFGVDAWFAPHDMQGGQTILEQLTEQVQRRSKVILVLSEASMASHWVATEILRARNAEQQTGARKLFPIRLVGMDKLRAWELFDADTGQDVARRIREYFIPDFSQVQDDLHFSQAVTRLIHDLRASS
ncbi:toll/interleukin-1 receptor domain-containing protein [Streptomyces resistomycificus]|uniref:toll/interleukin-1 receptor domain-containing protein n=1 Tax=Streptomyces resistomycificus TaxID=67356 RepID=UPI0012FEF79B|nr:toll/interleukin-1 receptor domain-containing protein [Streptomyces resistomycificus]